MRFRIGNLFGYENIGLAGWGLSAACHAAAMLTGYYLAAAPLLERVKLAGSTDVVSVIQLQMSLAVPEEHLTEVSIQPQTTFQPEYTPTVETDLVDVIRKLEEPVNAPQLPATQKAEQIVALADSQLHASEHQSSVAPAHPTSAAPPKHVPPREPLAAVVPVVVVEPPGFDAVDPARPTKSFHPEYPAEAVRRRIEGQVVLRITVSPQGFVSRVEVARSSGHSILDDAAAEAVQDWEFAAARRGGEPVSWSVLLPVNFHF